MIRFLRYPTGPGILIPLDRIDAIGEGLFNAAEQKWHAEILLTSGQRVLVYEFVEAAVERYRASMK